MAVRGGGEGASAMEQLAPGQRKTRGYQHGAMAVGPRSSHAAAEARAQRACQHRAAPAKSGQHAHTPARHSPRPLQWRGHASFAQPSPLQPASQTHRKPSVQLPRPAHVRPAASRGHASSTMSVDASATGRASAQRKRKRKERALMSRLPLFCKKVGTSGAALKCLKSSRSVDL